MGHRAGQAICPGNNGRLHLPRPPHTIWSRVVPLRLRTPLSIWTGPPMLAKLRTFSLLGIEALPVEVEVDVSDSSLPKTVLVGLPEAAVKECTHRIERALVN